MARKTDVEREKEKKRLAKKESDRGKQMEERER